MSWFKKKLKLVQKKVKLKTLFYKVYTNLGIFEYTEEDKIMSYTDSKTKLKIKSVKQYDLYGNFLHNWKRTPVLVFDKISIPVESVQKVELTLTKEREVEYETYE